MKTQQILMLFLSYSLLFSSCNKADEEHSLPINKENFKTQIGEDPIFKELISIQSERLRTSRKKKYFKNFNIGIVKAEIKNCKTQKEKIALYQKAGMNNAGEYLGFIAKEFKLLSTLKQRYPEMKNFREDTKTLLVNSLKVQNQKMIEDDINEQKGKFLK